MPIKDSPLPHRDLVRIAAVEVALLAALAATLLALGRVLTCPCGTVAVWAGNI